MIIIFKNFALTLQRSILEISNILKLIFLKGLYRKLPFAIPFTVNEPPVESKIVHQLLSPMTIR